MSKPFDLEEFKAFVASKPAGEWYSPGRPRSCALAQFGFPGIVTQASRDQVGISLDVYRAAVAGPPYTFGALADRLSTLTDDTP